MDIQKERELFEAWVIENLADGRSMSWEGWCWKSWQAAKAQAVPEGFVVFPKKQTSKMRSLARDFDARLSLTKYEQLHNIWVKQAMIEAQEQNQ